MVIEVVTLTFTLFSLSSYLNSPSPDLATPLPKNTAVTIKNETPSPTPTQEATPTPSLRPQQTEPLEVKMTDATPTPPQETPTPTQEATPTPTISSPNEIDSFFDKYSSEYGIDKELLKKIAQCESGFNPLAENGEYKGMFQFAASSWSSARSQMGLDPNPELRMIAEEAIRTASSMLAKGQQNAWRNCL